MRLKIVSLFSGCGGMDLGIEGGFSFLGKNYKKLNTEIVYATDFDERMCQIYNANFRNKCVHENVRKLDSARIPNHDILTGGFPCQSFSVVAQNPKRLGYKDKNGRLFFEMCRILKEKKPRVFIAENVKGILSANKGDAFPLILKEFKKAGYKVKYRVLNASHYGVPQKRKRVFIVGFKKQADYNNFNFPTPTTEDRPVPLSKILFPEPEIEEKYYFSKKAVNGLKKSKNFKNMNKGRAQNIDEPCNTVGAHLAKVSLNSTDPVLNISGRFRMFTPREVARIQSFPDKFKLPSSKTTNYRALGNAVPPVLMWHLSNRVIAVFGGKHGRRF